MERGIEQVAIKVEQKNVEQMKETTALYRHFSSEGALLYVGISLSWPARTKAHVKGSRWFDNVARVEIERFPSRQAALDAEREAIKSEHPQFNIIHNRNTVNKQRDASRKPRTTDDPILRAIRGPDAIVGPALNYQGDMISIIVAHGEAGKPGELAEIVLGEWAGEVPAFLFEACDTVATIRRGDQINLDEAREMRANVIRKLTKHLRTVEVCNTDIALAVANAFMFPSAKSEKILDDVAVERAKS